MSSTSSLLLLVIISALLFTDVNTENRLKYLKSAGDFLNICPRGNHHKQVPTEESVLHGPCSDWQKRSCCTTDISENITKQHVMYNFNYNHCPGHHMSAKCKRHFLRDLCFYECSPNVGPWLVKVSQSKIRNERFVKVPLCKSECDSWWNDCKDEYTCRSNWAYGFNWTTGTNRCPEGSMCKTFTYHFKTAKKFCEQIWDQSYVVASDDEMCFRMWFNGSSTPNPNDKVASLEAARLQMLLNHSHKFSISIYIVSLMSIVTFFLNSFSS
ncbi:folate receptor gamma-like isoform X2 [Tubulanus polymorphus]